MVAFESGKASAFFWDGVGRVGGVGGVGIGLC